MKEHRILAVSVSYDTVLPSGNLYTKRLMERIVKQFKEDEKFRDSMFCVPQSTSHREELDYLSVAGKIVNLWIDESEQRLMAELLILDTPCGRLIEEAFRRCDTINVVPSGIADCIEVDGIHILSADKYELCHFEIIVESLKTSNIENGEKQQV